MIVTLASAPQNKRYAAQLREPTTADLKKRNREALKVAAPLMAAGVIEDISDYMPDSGGYAAVLAGALRSTVRAGGDGVTITDRAKGKKQSRDLRSLERGRLRHPLFGWRKKRRSPGKGTSLFYDTSIPPGFFSKPITKRAHIAQSALVEVMQAVAKQVTRG